jgi:hypothetical protein
MMDKAECTEVSARRLLQVGDTDSACKRLLCDVRRACVVSLVHAPVAAETVRTHNGLIAAFSLHLVKTGRVFVKPGRALKLNRTGEIRLIVDYQGNSVESNGRIGRAVCPGNAEAVDGKRINSTGLDLAASFKESRSNGLPCHLSPPKS